MTPGYRQISQLRQLREVKLLTFQGHVVTIHDRAGLKALAGYEDIEEGAVVVRDDNDQGNG